MVIPAELEALFKQETQLRKFFASFNNSIRRWICDEIAKKKSAAARERRAEQVAEQLLETIEAERDLPPLIKNAFAEDPKAYKGWKSMTPLARRGQLLATFYYRNPDSRARRLAKVMEVASTKIKA